MRLSLSMTGGGAHGLKGSSTPGALPGDNPCIPDTLKHIPCGIIFKNVIENLILILVNSLFLLLP